MVELSEYRERVQQLRQYAADHNITETQTSGIFRACFRQLETKYSEESNRSQRSLRLALFIALILTVAVSVHLCCQEWLNDMFVRISQNSIYPALYVLRKIAIPVISLYPSLTGL